MCIRDSPYTEDPAWEQEENSVLDREKTPYFAEKIAAMRADVVVDLSSFRLADTKAMAEALQKAGCAEHMYKFFECTAPETSGIAVQSYIGRGLIRV